MLATKDPGGAGWGNKAKPGDASELARASRTNAHKGRDLRSCMRQARTRQISSLTNKTEPLFVRTWQQYKSAAPVRCQANLALDTGPRRNTAQQEPLRSQRAGAAWTVAVLYARASSVRNSFRHRARDLRPLVSVNGLYQRLSACCVGKRSPWHMLMELSARFLDANQGSGRASKADVDQLRRVRESGTRRVTGASRYATHPMYLASMDRCTIK